MYIMFSDRLAVKTLSAHSAVVVGEIKVCFSSFQQHLSYTTLNDLAQALIDGTVYEIIQGLLDIQHLMEGSADVQVSQSGRSENQPKSKN
uniref:Uncharacterized protein n=1 Tax=Sinocyclocheilus anshuiensis TaxID=1608454 RepID=A0A671P4X9_9TELE